MNKILSALLFTFALLPPLSYGAVAYDTTSTAQSGNTTALTAAHTITGANTVLICTVHVADGNPAETGVTFDGNTMSLLGTITNGATRLAMYGIVAAAGTHNVVVSFSSASALVRNCTSFTGVDPITPFGTAVTSSDFSGTGVAITVPANGMGYDAATATNSATLGCTSHTVAGGGTQTAKFSGASYCLDQGVGASTDAFGSTITATLTMLWSAEVDAYNVQIGIPINPVSAAVARNVQIIVVE